MTKHANRLSYDFNKKEIIKNCTFLVLIFAAILFSIWKCKFGFGSFDEPFYLTIPHRLTLGDALLKHEWNLSQLSGFLLYPFVWLYTTITGGTTGIILAARYAYVFVHLIVSVVIYLRLQKYGYSAVIASVLYFLFTPFNIMALSYNSMGLDLITLTGVLLATANPDKKLSFIFSGICFAGAVLCQPYIMIAYALFILCVLINIACKKLKLNNIFTGYYFSLKTFLYFTLGAGILAVLFFAFLLPRTSIADIFNNLPYMLNDPQHPHIPLSTRLSYYFSTLWNCAEMFNISLIAFGVILLIMLVDRKRLNHRGVYLALTSVTVLFAYYTFFTTLTTRNYNTIMIPMLYLGIASYILTKNKNKALMSCLFMLSVVFSFACCIASNQYIYIISCALVAANVASIIFIGNVIKEMITEKEDDSEKHILLFSYEKKKTNKSYFISSRKLAGIIGSGIMVVTILSQGFMQVIVKSNHVFWDQSPSALTVTIEGGPADGIATTEYNATRYKNTLNDIQLFLANYSDKNILFLTEATWTYLATHNLDYGTYSAWIVGGTDIAVSRLTQYYALNPDKIPTYVYIPFDTNLDPRIVTATTWGAEFNISKTNNGYLLAK